MKSAVIASILACLVFCIPLISTAEESSPQGVEIIQPPDAQPGNKAGPDEGGRTRLEEVVVTATRLPTPAKELPVPVQVITRKEIEESHAGDLAELLTERLPEHFQKYPGALSSVSIRGFRSDTTGTDIKGHVLVLIDGHRAGTGNIAVIPLENVERVEIVRGPGSVVYGSAAMGGVVNVITRRGKGALAGESGLEYGSYDYVKGHARVSGGFLGDRIGVSLTGRSITQGCYERGSGEKVPNTGYNDQAYSGSLVATPNPNHSLFAVFNYFDASDVGFPDAAYTPPPTYAHNKDILRGYGSLDYDGAVPEWGLNWRLSYYNVVDRNRWNAPSGDWGYLSTTTQADTQGIRSQFGFPTFSFGRLLFGFDWDGIDVTNWTSPAGNNWTPDSRYNNYAFFAEEKIDWNKLTLLFGVRYDLFKEDLLRTPGLDVTASSQEFDHLSWRTGVKYAFCDWLSGRAAVGTAFRAPTADELAGRFHMGSWSKIVGNPDLKPESGITYEAGLDAEYAGFTGGLGYFHTKYDDKISAGFPACVDGDCTWTTSKNVAGAVLAAVEGTLGYKRTFPWRDMAVGVRPFVNFVFYTRRELEDEDYISILRTKTVPYVPQWDATGGLEIDFNRKVKFLFSGFYLGEEKRENWDWLSPTYTQAIDGGGFMVFSARLSYRPTKHLELFIVSENLTDRDYSYVDGYPMPGRTFRGGFTARF